MDKDNHSLIKVHIEEIDRAHHVHVQLLNELSDAIEKRNVTKEHIEKIMNSLKGHFEYEEDLMEKHNVPTLAPHKKEHTRIIYEFVGALDLIGKDDIEEKSRHVEYLRELFLSHIDLWDSQYVPYINEGNKKL